MTIEPLKPIDYVDWTQVEFVRVTLEKPWGRSGGLRFRLGTRPAILNLDYDARKRNSKRHIPGTPIMYPPDRPVRAGTTENSFIMPASMTRTIWARDQENHPAAVRDPDAHAAFTAFGFFMAPVDDDEIAGFKLGAERERIATFWGGYKYPEGDGTMRPPMTHVAPPDIPHVALTLLDRNQQPILVDGEEVVIRPREFYDFDSMGQYDLSQKPARNLYDPVPDKDTGLSLTSEEMALVRELIEAKRGKKG